MRDGKPSLITNDAGDIGFMIEADHCAEHECGINDLRQAMEMPDLQDPASVGLVARAIVDPARIRVVDTRKHLGLVFNDSSEPDIGREGVWGAWGKRSAAIVVTRSPKADADAKRALALMQRLVKACKTPHAILLMLGGQSTPFGGGGLVIALRADVMANPAIDASYVEADRARHALQAAWTPVEAHLRALLRQPRLHRLEELFYGKDHYKSNELKRRGKQFMYMRPRQMEAAPVDGSKYPFRVWLNTEDQAIHEAGWYTVEELEAWARGEGPVIEHSRFARLELAKEAILAGKEAYPLDYYAICRGCGYIYHDGNASGRDEMLFGRSKISWSRASKLTECPCCKKPGASFVFSNDKPEAA